MSIVVMLVDMPVLLSFKFCNNEEGILAHMRNYLELLVDNA